MFLIKNDVFFSHKVIRKDMKITQLPFPILATNYLSVQEQLSQ